MAELKISLRRIAEDGFTKNDEIRKYFTRRWDSN